MFFFINACEEFHEFHNEFIKKKEKKKIIDQMMLMDSKYFLFDVIKSEFIWNKLSKNIRFTLLHGKMSLMIVPNVLSSIKIS